MAEREKVSANDQAGDRLIILDILRGYALVGILLIIVQVTNCHFILQGECLALWNSTPDRWITHALQLFVTNKFFPIFSFLFGAGIAMQYQKLFETGRRPYFFFIRRMAGLFLLGVAHIVFLFSGDILHIYAVLGVCAMLLYERSNGLIIGVSFAVLVFPWYHHIFRYVVDVLPVIQPLRLEGYGRDTLTEFWRTGSYWGGVKFRIGEYLYNIDVYYKLHIPMSFFMFSTGIIAQKTGIIRNLEIIAKRIQKPILLVFIVAMAEQCVSYFNLLPGLITTGENLTGLQSSLYFWLLKLVRWGSNIVIAFFHIWLVIRALGHRTLSVLLRPLRHIGRMALTNYILISIICLFLFTSSGLAMYMSVSPVQQTGIVVLIVVFQVLFSKIWLSYFQFGPLEWIWRCFSYMRILPLKRSVQKQGH